MNHFFEVAVVERVVLRLHCKPLIRGIKAGSFRHRPALQHALELEAKVVMQSRGGVALDVVAQLPAFRCALSTAGFRRDVEIAHLAIALETVWHSSRIAKCSPARGNCYRLGARLTCSSVACSQRETAGTVCAVVSANEKEPWVRQSLLSCG